MLEAKLATELLNLEPPENISKEDRIKAGQLLTQVIDVFSSHPKAVNVLDLASARQSITIPLREHEEPEIPVDNLNVATLIIIPGYSASDTYQLRLRERGVERTSVITQDIFWHVEKPRTEGKLAKLARRISGKPQKTNTLQVKDVMTAVWTQTYSGDVPDASINITKPDQTIPQNSSSVSKLSEIQQEILDKLPELK